jgi:uncharacterized membrane-anchored protein YhcB (DUF1043 family)
MHQQAGEFVAVMLHSATATHLMHLATKSYAETLLQFAKGARKSLPDDSELQNIIDEIVAEVATLLYKCKTFK